MRRRTKSRRRSRVRASFNIRIVTAVVLAAAAVAASVQLWNVTDGGDESRAQRTSISLRLSGPFGARFAGEIVAVRAKLFERNGIDIELNEPGEGVDPTA